MTASVSMRQYGRATAIGGAGAALAWLSGEPSGFLAAIAAVCIHAGLTWGLLSIAIGGLATGALHLSAPGAPMTDLGAILQLGAFLAAALAIAALILDHRRVEAAQRAALRASERHLKSIVENIPGMIGITDAEGRRDANRQLLDYVGLELSEATDQHWAEVIHPDDRPAAWSEWRRCMAAGEPVDLVYRRRRFDGVYRWFHVRATPVQDDGKIIRWYSLVVDVDDMKRTEEALRRSEQQLRLMIDTIPMCVWCATPEGEPSYINKRLMDYAGLTIDSLATPGGSRLSGAIQAVVHPDDTPALRSNLTHSFRTGAPFAMKYRHRRADGAYRWVDGRADPLRDADGRIVQWYGVLVDIDDETRMQEALRSAHDRLARAAQAATLAELSASIAHEVNQPLAAVVNNSHACLRWLSAEPPNLERARLTAERIIRDANAAADVVSRIRALFKQSPSRRSPIDVNEVIAEVCQLMADEVATRNASLETALGDDLPAILADRVQMQQVLVNLIRNGVEAMDAIVDAPKPLVIRSRRDGTGTVLVEIRDRGGGVVDAKRIFEPFFTTKEDGMGMGLAICRSIVEAHGGQLSVARGDPHGAVFTVALPVSASEAA